MTVSAWQEKFSASFLIVGDSGGQDVLTVRAGAELRRKL